MQFVSFFGLAVLLGIAWVISEHRSKVKVRTIFWGLGLQFLFAVIILRPDYWSFVGMALLGVVVVYLALGIVSCGTLFFPLPLIGPIFAIAAACYTVFAAIKSHEGEWFEYAFVGSWARRQVGI